MLEQKKYFIQRGMETYPKDRKLEWYILGQGNIG